MLKLCYFYKEFSTKSIIDNNPVNNLVKVNGFLVPINTLPIEMQNIVRQARAGGKDVEFITI